MSTALSASSTKQPGYLAEMWARREFAWYLALGGMRARHARTSLGALWWVLNPLLQGLVYLLVFGFILDTRRGDPNYIGFLLSGMFPFFFIASALNQVPASVTTNAKLLTTQQFPRMILPIATLIQGAIGFISSLGAFFLISGFSNGDWPGWFTLALPAAVIVHVLFTMGLSLIVAQLTIPFRDIGQVIPLLTRIWFFTSPIIYPLDERLEGVSPLLFQLFSLNPLASILDIYRYALMGRDLEMQSVLFAIGWAALLLLIGTVTFRRNETNLVRYL